MTAPKVPPAPEITAKVPRTFTFDTRSIVGAALGLVCLGLIIGSKMGKGMPNEVRVAVPVATPCAECEEKKIQAARAAVRDETAPQQINEQIVQHAVPGDSSVPD
jgi:hypothetical protein